MRRCVAFARASALGRVLSKHVICPRERAAAQIIKLFGHIILASSCSLANTARTNVQKESRCTNRIPTPVSDGVDPDPESVKRGDVLFVNM